MMRRARSLVLVIAMVAPVIANAGNPDLDPNGLVATDPAMIVWLDSVVQVLVGFLGI